MSNFETLAAINVNDKIEKKGRFSYLSWAWAVDTLLRADPAANWAYSEPVTYPDGTMMVFCTVTAFGVPRTMQLPVIDSGNKPIKNPNAFQINTAMQRCLVKAIALHGLGLYIYAGEDVPRDDEPEVVPAKKASISPNDAGKEFWDNAEGDEKVFLEVCLKSTVDLLNSNPDGGAELAADFFYKEIGSIEESLAVWSQLDSKQRAAIRKFKPLDKAA